MDLAQLANLGEFIGGVAVLVTLIYLALQIRQNTNGLRAASSQRMSEQVERFVDLLICNEEARNAWTVGAGWDPTRNLQNPQNLTESALTQLHLMMYRSANASHSQYRMWRDGTLGKAEFEQLKPLVRIWASTPAALDWWEHQAPALFDDDFVRFVRQERGRSPYAP